MAELVTIKQLAAEWQVHVGTIHRWYSKGWLPGKVRLPGGHVRFRRADIRKCERPETRR